MKNISKALPASYPNMLGGSRHDLQETHEDCTYYNDGTSHHIQEIVEQMWSQLTITLATNATMGLWHIRRSDSKGRDTSTSKMETIVDCSFAGSRALGNITILIMTDETEQKYLETLYSYFEPFPHIQVFNLDELAVKHVRTYAESNEVLDRLMNNFVVYSVEKTIQGSRVAFVLEHQ